MRVLHAIMLTFCELSCATCCTIMLALPAIMQRPLLCQLSCNAPLRCQLPSQSSYKQGVSNTYERERHSFA